MEKKFTWIFLIVIMAFAMCAFVSLEDVQESDAVYGREMLKESRPELLLHRDTKQIETWLFPLPAQISAYPEERISSPALLSLTTCILRC